MVVLPGGTWDSDMIDQRRFGDDDLVSVGPSRIGQGLSNSTRTGCMLTWGITEQYDGSSRCVLVGASMVA